jgi:hypothetical protein
MDSSNTTVSGIISLVLRAVALAMGVTVVVLGILGVVEVDTSVTLLAIGLLCLALDALNRGTDAEGGK